MNHLLIRGFMEMVVFRLNRRFRAELEKAEKSASVIEKSKARMRMIHEAFFTVFELLVTGIKAGIVIYAWQTGALSVGAVVALITLVGNAYQPVAIFNVLFVQYKLDKTAYARFEEILNMPEDRMLESGEAVSYTHLDVYKRQILNNSHRLWNVKEELVHESLQAD